MNMKAVILAGGMGTRIAEESSVRPKPMIEIGGKPILWHIMKIYSSYGINDFIICLGYKGYMIKEYFANYYHHTSDITFDFINNTETIHDNYAEPWRVTLVNTGEHTMTGGRLKRVYKYIKDDKAFCLTYGDGVADINIKALLGHHDTNAKLATVTAVKPPGRFGALNITADNTVGTFTEKPSGDGSYISGGFFIMSPKVIDYIENIDTTILEQGPLKNLAKDGQLSAYKHEGFWQPMDTLRDKQYLEGLWQDGSAPWKIWK